MKDLHSMTYPAVSPSLLAADKARIGHELARAERAGATFIHIDVMDGKFVPNVSFSLDFVREYAHKHHMVNDVHIMEEEPWVLAPKFVEAGADIVTFHYEACPDQTLRFATIEAIHRAGGLAGISIKPDTPVSVLEPFLPYVDLILIMSVEPGKGGQPFLPGSLEKLDELKALLAQNTKKYAPVIEIDGGIKEDTYNKALAHGAQILVAGSYLFGHEDFADRVALMLQGR